MRAQDLTPLHRELLGGIYWTDYVIAPVGSDPAERRCALAELLDAGFIRRNACDPSLGWEVTAAGERVWRESCRLSRDQASRSGLSLYD